jgi:MFS transporter, SP family, arabinose:H+ symporter
MKLNLYLVKGALVGALGGLLFGLDTAVIAGTTGALTSAFALTPARLGITVSIALWGTVIGALTAGIPGEWLGGRGALRIMAALYLTSALGCAVAWSWPSLLIFPLIGGLVIGGWSVLGPAYIAELAPPKWRGRLVGLFQINVVVGILLAYLSNFLLAKLPLGNALWHWQLGIAALPALFFLLMLFTIPRSSRWLITQNRTEEAHQVLEMIGSPKSDADLREVIGSIHLDRQQSHEPLFSTRYLLPIFLAVTLGMFNQLSGINAILYYINDIFLAAGFSRLSSDGQAVIIGATNLFATLIAMSLIDKLGRKTLLLAGSVGMVICLAGVARLFPPISIHQPCSGS